MKTLIKNGTIHPVTSPSFVGDILVEDGKIVGVEPGIQVKADTLIEASGLHVFPGLVEEHCHIGIHGEKTNQVSDNDVNEWSDPVTPQLLAMDGVKPFDEGFRYAISAGVTTLNIFPGSANPIGGFGVTLKNDLDVPYQERVLLERSGMKMAMGENPKKTHQESKKIMTRMGTAAVIRKAFSDAIAYRKKKDEKGFDPKNEALLQVLDGEFKAHVHAHRADDMLTILRIRDEFGFQLSFEHATESHLIADLLAEKGVELAVGPMFTARYKIEVNNRTLRTPGILEKAGISDISLITDDPVIPILNLPIQAGLAMHHGLSGDLALRAITINPARNLGLADRIGSIEKGKDGDLLVCDRDVLDPTHRLLFTLVNGKVAFDSSKQELVL
ncbi:MAG TPA: amidohydrolase family protein [Thermotogota bacterium]|nr:amidohydrolase family protein [Thermotogota bacterium]HRW92921.1 amidohydrolase family protein [Thermotogota bacterium]